MVIRNHNLSSCAFVGTAENTCPETLRGKGNFSGKGRKMKKTICSLFVLIVIINAESYNTVFAEDPSVSIPHYDFDQGVINGHTIVPSGLVYPTPYFEPSIVKNANGTFSITIEAPYPYVFNDCRLALILTPGYSVTGAKEKKYSTVTGIGDYGFLTDYVVIDWQIASEQMALDFLTYAGESLLYKIAPVVIACGGTYFFPPLAPVCVWTITYNQQISLAISESIKAYRNIPIETNVAGYLGTNKFVLSEQKVYWTSDRQINMHDIELSLGQQNPNVQILIDADMRLSEFYVNTHPGTSEYYDSVHVFRILDFTDSGPIIFTSSTYIATGDYSYDGQDIVINGCVLTIDGEHQFNSLQIINNGIVNHSPATSGEEDHKIHLTILQDLTISDGSQITADGMGYGGYQGPGAGDAGNYDIGGGGGYGGQGGSGYYSDNFWSGTFYSCDGGGTYGSIIQPMDFGSSGGYGGAGGGIIRLNVGGTLLLDGNIESCGASMYDSGYGGGAGGSIWLTVGCLDGCGAIRADGGSGGSYDWSTNWPHWNLRKHWRGGGGGGGRIAIYYGSNSFTGDITANGGGGSGSGGAGTVYLQFAEPPWSFVQMTDLHIGSARAQERFMDALRQIEEENHELILVTGDIVHYAAICWMGVLCEDSGYFERYKAILEYYPDLKSKITEVPGNHDRCDQIYGYFGLSLYENDIRAEHDYSFHLDNHDGVEFIGLDTGWGHTTSWGLSGDQVEWLRKLLQVDLDKTKHKVIFLHHPALDPYPPAQSFGLHWEEFFRYIDSNNVDLVLAGHTHEDHIDSSAGTWHVQTSSLGQSDPSVYRIIDVKDGKVIPRQVTEVKKYDKKDAALHSAGNLHVYDSIGRHVGMSDSGQAERGIPDSFYFSHYSVSDSDGNIIHSLPEEIILYDTLADYIYEVVGTQTGTYRLVINSVENGNEKVFEAIDIPTVEGAVHQYVIDWDALSEGEPGVTVFIDRDGDGDFEKTVVSDSVLTSDEFDTPSVVEVIVSEAGDAVQDGITLTAEATDIDGVDAVYFYVREPDDGNGVPIGQEDLAATFNPATGKWECAFDTTQLQDGYYVVLAKAVDVYGNEGWSEVVPFSIRNWAIIKLLPATPSSKAGRTMPVKFSIRIAQSVDPAMPFVYNEDLEIRIYKSTNPSVILQRSLFGPGATDYRIDIAGEKYVTNFKTLTTPATYVVEIWRPEKNFKVGSFTFKTVK